MAEGKVLTLRGVDKSYKAPNSKEDLKVLLDLTIDIYEKEIVSLIGPSGCGKSTVLNIAAGFEMPDKGRACFKGDLIHAPSVKRAVVFQSAVLFPWLTALENIAYGLKLQTINKCEVYKKCSKYIELVGLKGFEHYYPKQLSGGMQQRVSLARVLVLEPELLLMDEPFASLDAQNRITMHQLLMDISYELRPAIFFVTHDVEEALFLSDRIYIMTDLPGSVRREIAIPFSKPRSMALFSDREFVQLKQEIFNLLLPEAF